MIVVNVLATMWKWGGGLPLPTGVRADAPRPPVLDEDTSADLEVGAPLPLKDAGPGYAALGSLGYADDTQAVAVGAASLQGAISTTEEWLQVTGQDVRVDKSCSWVQGEQRAPAVLLRGVPPSRWRRLAANRRRCRHWGFQCTGPVLSRRLEAGRSALRRLPHLSTYDRRERAISALVTPLALYGVAVASVMDPDLQGMETAAAARLPNGLGDNLGDPRSLGHPGQPEQPRVPRVHYRGDAAPLGQDREDNVLGPGQARCPPARPA